jgi:hypothetical protein
LSIPHHYAAFILLCKPFLRLSPPRSNIYGEVNPEISSETVTEDLAGGPSLAVQVVGAIAAGVWKTANLVLPLEEMAAAHEEGEKSAGGKLSR